jgi:hypothetical protein
MASMHEKRVDGLPTLPEGFQQPEAKETYDSCTGHQVLEKFLSFAFQQPPSDGPRCSPPMDASRPHAKRRPKLMWPSTLPFILKLLKITSHCSPMSCHVQAHPDEPGIKISITLCYHTTHSFGGYATFLHYGLSRAALALLLIRPFRGVSAMPWLAPGGICLYKLGRGMLHPPLFRHCHPSVQDDTLLHSIFPSYCPSKMVQSQCAHSHAHLRNICCLFRASRNKDHPLLCVLLCLLDVRSVAMRFTSVIANSTSTGVTAGACVPLNPKGSLIVPHVQAITVSGPIGHTTHPSPCSISYSWAVQAQSKAPASGGHGDTVPTIGTPTPTSTRTMPNVVCCGRT